MQIKTLVPDIYSLLQEEDWKDGINLQVQLKGRPSQKGSLRLSALGPRCPRALWYSVHRPELAEKLPPWAEFKYAYGHIIEATAVVLAKKAGHHVTGEQDELVLDGVVGHRDCVIDGCVVDIKSSSSFSFNKFKDGSIARKDDFGYLDQLDGYVVASHDDPLVTCKDKGYLLVIDKTLGHMCLYEHTVRRDNILERIKSCKAIIASNEPPRCECESISDGKSGNIKLDIKASYSLYKHCCFPNLRTFLYASGPVYLTHVARKPDVIEVDKHGKVVYN